MEPAHLCARALQWMFNTNASYSYQRVMELTVTDCADIPNTRCEGGHVTELLLNSRGLSGVLDFNHIAAFSMLKKVSFSYNRLSGQVLSTLFSSPQLEEAYLTKNMFSWLSAPLGS